MVRHFMNQPERRSLEMGVAMLILAMIAGPLSAEAQTYPTRGITLIDPFAAGASHEIFTRAIIPYLSKKLGAPVDIICKPGGAGVVATLEVMKARRDGYTLLVDCPGSSSLQKALGKELPYNIEERTYLACTIMQPHAIFVPAERPWKNLKDLEEAIRKDPASFKWPSCGGTGFSDLVMHILREGLTSRGVDLSQNKIVPFISATPANTAVAGGHVDIYSGSNASIAALLDAGKIRVIAVTSKERTKFFPGIPTCIEQGYPKFVAHFWIGYSGPPGLPKIVVDKWINALRGVVTGSTTLPIFDKVGGEPLFVAGEDFKKYVLDEAKSVERMGIAK